MPAATERLPSALAWLGFQFAEIDTQLKDAAAVLRDLAAESSVCGPSADRVAQLRWALRSVWKATDDAAARAAKDRTDEDDTVDLTSELPEADDE